jgi:hypothetical protein
MLMNGLDGQITTARRPGSASAVRFADRRRALQPHKIILEVEPTLLRPQPRAHRVVRHREEARGNPEATTEIVGDRREALARFQATGALDVGREVAVAEAEPCFAAQGIERRHEIPSLAAPSPAEIGIVLPRQGIEQRIEIG